MNKFIFLIMILSTIALASCGQNATKEVAIDKNQLCESITTLQQDIAKLNAVAPNSTITEVQAMEDKIEFAVDRLTDAEIVDRAAEQKALKQARENLENTVKNLLSKDTVGEEATKIQQAAAEVETARANLANGVQCP
jgi:signal transduction protein with GAF and PtsI domain